MTNDSKKTGLIAKLSALNQTMADFKGKCQPAWFIIKQTWYIPFLWSLAWYSYWIFHSAIVLKTPFSEGNISDYVGAGMSVAALIVAGYNSRRPIAKSIGLTFASFSRKSQYIAQIARMFVPKLICEVPDASKLARFMRVDGGLSL